MIDLVTGATGFIGSHLAERLAGEGSTVRILCRKGSERKLPSELRERLEIIHVDLAEAAGHRDMLARALEGVSRVFHCAGHVSDWGAEEEFMRLNVEATRVLLESADEARRASGILRRFVHLSSIAAFGTPSPAFFDDGTPLGDGRDPYSRTKAQGEKLALSFHARTGLPVTVIRPAVVYGPGGTWLEEPLKMIRQGKMFLLGGGVGTCHPCYIKNLVDALCLAAEHPRAVGRGYIVVDSGGAISFREYFDAVAQIACQGPIRRSVPLSAARMMAAGFEMGARLTRSAKRPLLTQTAIDMVTTKSALSDRRIREELGFSPRYSFRSAMMELRLPRGDFKAFIFDCDGTIADTMPLHYQSWLQALAPWKCGFPEDLFYAWGGRPGERIVELLNQKHGLKMPPGEVFRRKEEIYLELLPRVRPVEVVREQIEKRHGEIPFAVVSGSPRSSVLRTLEILGLSGRFEVILGCEDYARGKPDPEPFLAAASRLGVKPRDCLVFEDAELGIEAAMAAGMAWVKV